MNYTFKINILATLMGLAVIASSCQKMDRPELGEYPLDANPPGGPLKFYTAMDGSNVDSIRATFGTATNANYIDDGVSGKAYQGSADSYITYPVANDFNKSTSFTIAFWMRTPPPDPGIGAQFLFGQATSTDIWTKSDIFLLMEDGGQSNNGLAALKFYLFDQWLEFVNEYRLPVADDEWHHMAFVYDQTTSKLTTYVDGEAVTGLPSNKTDVMKNGAPRGPLDLSKATGFVIGGPSHRAVGATPDGWMVNYRGQLDQFRIYGEAVSASEIQNLFQNKL